MIKKLIIIGWILTNSIGAVSNNIAVTPNETTPPQRLSISYGNASPLMQRISNVTPNSLENTPNETAVITRNDTIGRSEITQNADLKNTLPTENTSPISLNITSTLSPEILPESSISLNMSTLTENQVMTGNQNITENQTVSTAAKIAQPSRLTLYTYKGQENYFYPTLPKRRDFEIDVGGYYQLKYSGRNFQPSDPNDHRWDRIIRDETYLKIPPDVANGTFKPETRVSIQIDGKLNKDLTVHFDIEQEPDFPNKYDVRVNHKNKELQFFHFDTQLKDGEFTDIKKSLDGVRYTQKESQWETTLALGKERSEPKKFESYGNGSTTYALGSQYILYGSVAVYVNNSQQSEGGDYTINYFEGKITFKRPIQKFEYIKVVYEYTNPIQDFIPSLTRKNFIGAQVKYRSKDIIEINSQTAKNREILWPKRNAITPSENSVTLNNQEFQLEKTPIVMGSVTLKMNQIELVNQKDFFIDYSKGKIMLEKPLSKEDGLVIDYEYYLTELKEQEILGQNTTGPYKLEKNNIIKNSELIFIDGKKVIPNIDYILDNAQGRLYFNYPVNFPHVISIQYKIIETKTAISTTQKNPFKIGITYANESSKPEDADNKMTITDESITSNIETNVSSNITSNVMYTKESPITTPENLIVKLRSGLVLTQGTDYQLIDAYKGKIQITSSNIAANAEFLVSYKYLKSAPSKLFFIADRGKNIYDSASSIEFQIKDLPVKFNGVRSFRITQNGVTQEIRNENNKVSFKVDYNDNGTSIRLTFIKNSETLNHSSLLDEYPEGTVIMNFDYIPAVESSGQVEQTAVGLTIEKAINPRWNVQSEIAASQYNFDHEELALDRPEIIQGNPDPLFQYVLAKKLIVEGSEQVFIAKARVASNNTLLKDEKNQFIPFDPISLTKDNDYYINYASGTIKLRNITLDSSRLLVVNYLYTDTSVTKKGQTQSGMALKLGTDYKNEDWNAAGYYKYIDKKFRPIGQLNTASGTEAFGGNATYKFLKKNTATVEYNHQKIDRGINDNSKPIYLRQNYFKGSTAIQWPWTIQSSHSLELTEALQDPQNLTAAKNSHEVDNSSQGLKNNISFGPDFFKTSLLANIAKTTFESTDKDNENYKIHTEEAYQVGSVYSPKKFPWLYRFRVAPTYQQTNDTNDFIYSDDVGKSKTQLYSLSTSIDPFKFLQLSGDYSFSRAESLAGKNARLNKNEALNTKYIASFEPIYWFKSRYSAEHSESYAFGENQVGNISDAAQYGISRFELYDGLIYLGRLKKYKKYLKPLRKSFMSFNAGQNKTSGNNNLTGTNSNYNKYDLNNFSPINGITFENVNISNSKSESINKIITAVQQGYQSQTNRNTAGGSLSVAPTLPFLKAFNYTLYIENITDTAINEYDNISTTDNRSIVNSPRYTQNQKINWAPGNIVMPWRKSKHIDFGTFSASYQNDIKNIKNTTLALEIPTDSEKSIISTQTEDSSLFNGKIIQAAYSPFNIFSSTGKWVDNLTETQKSKEPVLKSIFFIERSNAYTAIYSPIRWLSLNGNIETAEQTKFAGGKFDQSLSKLKEEATNRTFNNFKEFTENKSSILGGGLSLTPLSILPFLKKYENKWSVSAGLTKKEIKTLNFNQATENSNIINESIISLGTGLRPFPYMTIDYTYTINTLTDKILESERFGNTSVLTIAYTPIRTQNVNIDIRFSMRTEKGQLTNRLAQSQTITGTGNLIQTQIVKTDNVETKASVLINVVVPIKSQPFIENITFQGEGYFKTITDNLDPEYAPQNRNSLSIGGILVKSTINF